MNRNKKINVNHKGIAATVLACTITVGSIGMPAISVLGAETSSNGKEEVVYVITDADGSVNNVNVVNVFGKGDVTDYGDYSAVKMLNSTETINKDGDKVTFTTDQDKVYYQGTLKNAEVPWNISVTYTLDGNEISPENLAGKTGALEIHIVVSQNENADSSFYEDYALQAALTLDTGNCKNIRADGATVANVGSDKQLSYIALPGKGLDATVTADVTDFTMDAITINGVRLNLDVDYDDDELMDKITEMMDAVADLDDGAIELSDGASKLTDGAYDLNDGVVSLDDGIQSLDEGIHSLQSGVNTMQTALNTLNAKSSELTSGSAQVLSALETIQSSLSGVSVTTSDLTTLTQSSAQILQGIKDLESGIGTLGSNLSYDAYTGALSQNGLDVSAVAKGNTEASSAIDARISALNTKITELESKNDDDSKALAEQLKADVEVLTKSKEALNGNSALIGATQSYFGQLSSAITSLSAGAAQLESSYTQFDANIQGMAVKLASLAENMSKLKSGIDELTSNYKTLNTGISDYTNAVATITSSYTQLVDGTNSLVSGSGELKSGSTELRDGSKELYDNMVKLSDGTKDLTDGTGTFRDETSDMDTQIETTIDDTLATLSGGDGEAVSFTSEKNTNVAAVQFVIKTTAIEKSDDTKVQEKEEQSLTFWEKFLNLFTS